ncbi:MAG TPA: hypothetical protein VFZ28_04240 [Burkholderiaceae bacterium]|nr:hypothetical protein [Burkholderiaceae bacterium]
MIRANEFNQTAAQWAARPLPPVSPRTDARDSVLWFDAADTGADVAIGGHLAPTARGLSVEQHASRVLMHLRDDGDRHT